MVKQHMCGWAFIAAGLVLLAAMDQWGLVGALLPASLFIGWITLHVSALTRGVKKG